MSYYTKVYLAKLATQQQLKEKVNKMKITFEGELLIPEVPEFVLIQYSSYGVPTTTKIFIGDLTLKQRKELVLEWGKHLERNATKPRGTE